MSIFFKLKILSILYAHFLKKSKGQYQEHQLDKKIKSMKIEH